MTQFNWNEEKEKEVAAVFAVKTETVKELRMKYDNIQSRIQSQYLAHIIRSLESYVRETCNAPFFRITCKPMTKEQKYKDIGCATYYKGRSFNIMYSETADERQARVCIAHELGHLFLLVISDREYNDPHEPLSSIFGIFTILDKNDFYEEKTVRFKHDSWKDIIRDFSLLKNRAEGKFNTSD